MEWNTLRVRGRRRVLSMLCLAGGLLATSVVVSGQPDSSEFQSGLVGTWTVQVTLRDCATNAQLGPVLNSLVTFHRGGTLSESAGASAFERGQRSAGHGTWSHQAGRTYSQEMVALVLFDSPPNPPASPGFFAGWQTVSHTVRLSDADNLTSTGTNAFYKLNGELYRTGCSTAVAQRFE
jgi:hypothetical protein